LRTGRPEIEGGVSKDEGEEKYANGLPRPSRRALRTLLRMRKPFPNALLAFSEDLSVKSEDLGQR